MQVPTVGSLVAATLCTLFIIQFKDTQATPVRKNSLFDPKLTLAVLSEVQNMIGEQGDMHKRRMDLGYQGRYGAANSVGSKLLALKTAADWNNPGRKRRDVSQHSLIYDNPGLSVAVLDELMEVIGQEGANYQKRRADMGYGSRYGAASSIGSKLMALKTAADWNSPGRKKRELDEEELHEQRPLSLYNPSLTLAVLEELRELCTQQESINILKRGSDFGYGGRYDAASSVGSKLLALKQAADSHSPGKRAVKEE